MKILVIGGSGFAGIGITRRLLRRGDEVTVLDINPQPHTGLKNHAYLTYKWKSVHDIIPDDISGHNIVLYLAAQADVPMGFTSPKWTTYQNVDGIVAALEACRGLNEVEKFILASSGNVYGRHNYLPIDEHHPLQPHNPYSFTKAAQEMAATAYFRSYGVPITIMSNGVVIGPGMRKEIFIYKWLYNILIDQPTILEGGTQTRDITYVSDVLDAWMFAIDAPFGKTIGQKFHVSYGEEHTLREILEMCYEVCDAERDIIQDAYRPGEQGQREQFDNSKAREILGYAPKVDPIKAITATAEWIEMEIKNDKTS